MVAKIFRTCAGPASLIAVVIGVWGLLGWQWGLIALGTPPSAFYIWGEIIKLRGAQGGE